MLGALRVMPAWVAPAATPPVAGYVGWWDASDASSITQSSGAVSQWADKSGNSKHLAQSTGSAKPTTGAVTQNGLNVLSFDGGDALVGPRPHSALPLTWFVVAVNDETGGTQRTLMAMRDAGSGDTRLYRTGGDKIASYDGGGGTAGSTSWSTTAHMISWTYAADSNQELFADAASQGSRLGNATPTWNATNWTVGGLSSSEELWLGKIGEIIAYGSVLGTTDRQSVEAYLTAKWGTP